MFSVGAIIGESDIIKNRERADTFIAVSTVYVLMFDVGTFEGIMNEFPEIKHEL